jgi:hypothetical protein
MAKVTGPLMSMTASGTLGGTLVYSVWKGRAYVRNHVNPANPKSAKQVGVRALFSFLTQVWTSISAACNGDYIAGAAGKSISTFNEFVSQNMARWQNSNAPTQHWPAAEASSGLTVTTMTLTGGVGMCTIALTPSGSTSIWGFIIYRSESAIVTPSWANAIAVIEADGTNAVTYVDSPLVAGDYHYRSAVFNVDGKLGTVKADAPVTVT